MSDEDEEIGHAPVIARPVQSIKNPVKAPAWKVATKQYRTDMIEILRGFCEERDFRERDVIDVALRDYISKSTGKEIPEPEGD